VLVAHQKEFQNALVAHREGRVADAQRIYTTLLDIYTDNFDVIHLLGLTFLQQGKLDRSAELMSKAIKLNPNSAPAHNNIGNIYKAKGLHKDALESFEKAIRLKPDYPDALVNRGIIRIKLGHAEQAISDFASAIKISPKSCDAYTGLGMALKKLDRLPEALDALEKAAAISPRHPEVLSNKGNLLLELGRANEAVEALDSAVRLRPQIAANSYNLANAYLAIGRMDDALKSYDNAISIRPDYAEAFSNRGVALKELKRLEEALESCNKAIGLRPDYAEAYSNRGMALKELKRLEEALESCERAINLRPDYAEAYSNRGVILRELKRLNEALENYDKAITLNPRYAEAFSNRGVALKEMKRLEEALESYDRAISLKPNYAEAYGNRANALSELKRLTEALENYDRAISLKPDYAEAYSNRGNALMLLQRPDEALESYDKAISINPDYAEGYYNKAILKLKERDFQEGFHLYRWRWDTKEINSKPLNTRIQSWDGSASAKNLLIWAEQGIVDEVFYSSMISMISSGIDVTLSADRRLHEIYTRSFPHLHLIDRSIQDQPIESGYDAQAAIADLGYLLNVSEEKIKRRRYPFLTVSSERAREHREKNEFLQDKPVCGLAWRSINRKFGDDKSIALRDLEPVLRIPGITFVNLQYGEVSAEIADVAELSGTKIYQARDLDVFNDIDGLLSLIDICDVVVTTSNLTAHLAGAIGKKSAVLVPTGKGRIWYWHEQPNSIWYPSLRILSQSYDWSWSSAISEAANWIKINIDTN
jgi:tetratricopeptide (TPR) repeat protein